MPVFLDSNIVLYSLGTEEAKRVAARALLAAQPCISTQVVNECSHVMRRKLGYAPAQVRRELSAVIQAARVVDISLQEIRAAWALGERYGYSHYDSLIIATALAAGCGILYTEDMQHGQVIDGRLKLLNPFLPENS
jgi:predicted nucleic acid-binding protein